MIHETEPTQFDRDYDAALANFSYLGGAVRLAEPISDPIIRAQEWGHAEKDEYTLPFGPWSLGETDLDRTPPASAGPWVYRYGAARSNTSSAYRVLATQVHGDVGSREGSTVIVTLLAPFRSAYPMAASGFLHHSYVREKFFADRYVHPGDLAAVTKLIGIVLGRETG